MYQLLLVSVVWALSLNVIGVYLAPVVDPYFAVLSRVILACCVFLPLMRKVTLDIARSLMLIGAFQFGMTYILLYLSYQYLTVVEILLFTTTTPIFVALMGDISQKTIQSKRWMAALLAVFSAVLMRFQWDSALSFWHGFGLLQLANASFAFGQVRYAQLQKRQPHSAQQGFIWFFVGALLITLPAFVLLGDVTRLPQAPQTWAALLFVGVFATALGQFFWNQGATKVDVGTLAVMNNAVIPIGIVLNLIFWDKPQSISILLCGSALMVAALWLNNRTT